MLWLALHFPALPLEIHSRVSAPSLALAVVEKHANRTRVIACSATADEQGVHASMLASAAQALAEGLVIRQRDRVAEAAALEGLALWAGRFTPGVSLQPPDGLLLEIGTCLKLHRGLDRLLKQIRRGLDAMGYRHTLAYAPTPSAAWLLARATPAGNVHRLSELERALVKLPIDLLDLPQDTLASLDRMGLHTLGDCLSLPRAGLARRFGQTLLDQLDRALGRLPEARAFYVAPLRFSRRLELPAPVEHAEALLFAAHRLLPELESYLARHQAGVQQLDLICEHEYMPATQVALGFVKPQRAVERIGRLLRETLACTALAAPVAAIVLEADSLLPLTAGTADLFASGSQNDDGNLLLERLRIRLGPEAVFGIATAADHRPEHAWQRCEAGTTMTEARLLQRPLWLLPRPRPCTDGELVLNDGPERIESGWWDGKAVDRDYYIARDRSGARLWVFCERASGEWFVHGLFA
ncbi:MAG: DNA polymerase Y family protein [Thiobacillus sp.]|nr:DNA polymerase Y family protein [Thiobacillus sp.]